MVEAVVDSLCKITLLRFIIAKLYFFSRERTSKNHLRGQSHFEVITYKGRQARAKPARETLTLENGAVV